SEGMLCSEEELNLEEKSTGIMILPTTAETGKDIASVLMLKDYVIDIDLTPNRADCLSMIGIAREIAALYDTHISLPLVEVEEGEEDVEKNVTVTIESPEFCPRYTARYVSGIKIQPSPLWMRRRLELAGIRPINNVVDVTNYILLEWGQPMHAFDYSLLDEGRVIVKTASSGDVFSTLDDKEQILDEETLMICDSSKYIAIGGIMGGLNTEVMETTTAVLLESAYFNPRNISRTSKKLGIKTEASLRFEKGINPETVIPALNRAAQLIGQLAGGEVARGIVDVYPSPIYQPSRIEIKAEKANRILGINISSETMAHYLNRLEISVETKDNETLVATIPPYRGDLKEDIDLAEEIARIHGYDQIPGTLPLMEVAEEDGALCFNQGNKIRSLLADNGFSEAITYSFLAPQNVKDLLVPAEHQFQRYLSISNPLSRDQSIMRTSLIPGLLMTAFENHNHKNMNLKLFELGKVFYIKGENPVPDEKVMLGGLMGGLRTSESWNYSQEETDFYDIKGVVGNIFQALFIKGITFQADNSIPYLHPGISSRIIIDNRSVGVLGEVNPHVLDNFGISKKIFIFEIDFGKIIYYFNKENRKAKHLPKNPPVYRDLALIVDTDIESKTIEDVICSSKVRYLDELKIFDVYEGEPISDGKKSLAYRIKFQAPDKSLTDEEVNLLHKKIINHLTKEMRVELRT
ncbi:MAG: phenylalanine--tRNA ligase subunit beta, partial [Proteobacteria bacterium]|nr:phenylalanine--tRNA ligase subunit beta [Pseudomonadota bacterium]